MIDEIMLALGSPGMASIVIIPLLVLRPMEASQITCVGNLQNCCKRNAKRKNPDDTRPQMELRSRENPSSLCHRQQFGAMTSVRVAPTEASPHLASAPDLQSIANPWFRGFGSQLGIEFASEDGEVAAGRPSEIPVGPDRVHQQGEFLVSTP
jgi:hypothetical protein